MRLFCLISFIGFVIGCSPSTQPSSSSSTRYKEDLSKYRPSAPEIVTSQPEQTFNTEPIEYVEPTEHLRAEIDSVLQIKKARNQQVGYLQGFTIQVYTGRNRDAANRAKEAVYEILIDERARVSYDQPMFRVKVGQFYSRLEAEKSFYLLREKFRQALVLPERISLK